MLTEFTPAKLFKLFFWLTGHALHVGGVVGRLPLAMRMDLGGEGVVGLNPIGGDETV